MEEGDGSVDGAVAAEGGVWGKEGIKDRTPGRQEDGEERTGKRGDEEVQIVGCEIVVDLRESGWPAIHCTQAQERGNAGLTDDAHDHKRFDVHVQVDGMNEISLSQRGGSVSEEVVNHDTKDGPHLHADDINVGNDGLRADDEVYASSLGTQFPMTQFRMI